MDGIESRRRPPEPDEAELLARARVKGPDGARAYEVLVRRHQAWLLRHLTFVLRSQSDAEDIAQDAFARAYLALDRAPPTKSFRGWLRVIATRLAFNRKRDEATRRRYHDRVAVPLSDATELGADAEHAGKLLAGVSVANRQLLVLKYVDELSVDEIAGTLGIGVSAVKMRLKRAREALLEEQRKLEASEHD